MSMSHIAKIHIILIKQTIISKSERKGDQVSGLLCPKLTELLYFFINYYYPGNTKFKLTKRVGSETTSEHSLIFVVPSGNNELL